jgi:hypothetical protein
MKNGTQLPIKISPLPCYSMRDTSGRNIAGYKLVFVLHVGCGRSECAVMALLCWPPC